MLQNKVAVPSNIVHLVQGPVYTKRQGQYCNNPAMTLVILFSLKSMEMLENRLLPQSGVTPLFWMRTESLASSQSCRSIDTDTWCKQTLRDVSAQDGLNQQIVLSWMQLIDQPNSFAPEVFLSTSLSYFSYDIQLSQIWQCCTIRYLNFK